MRYKCMYPGCNYETNDRKLIDHHHIIPRELGGSDKYRMYLCPTHHRHIYAPGAESGVHSKKSSGAIIIKDLLRSTAGQVLHYINCEDNTEYLFFYSTRATTLA